MTNNGDNNSHSSPFNGGAQWWLDLCKDFAWQPVRQVHPIDLREDADAIAALEQQMQRSQREARDHIASLRTDLAIAQQEKQSLLRTIGERQVVERRAAAQKQAGCGFFAAVFHFFYFISYFISSLLAPFGKWPR